MSSEVYSSEMVLGMHANTVISRLYPILPFAQLLGLGVGVRAPKQCDHFCGQEALNNKSD
mgnify:CR=1 FL=1